MVSRMKYSQYLFQYLTTVYVDCISIVTMFYSLYVNLLILFNRYLLNTQSITCTINGNFFYFHYI